MSEFTQHATITVGVKSWDESPVAGDAVPYLARLGYDTVYSGDLEGESTVALLASYLEGDAAEPHTLVGPYRGYERVVGTLAGRSGTFVLAADGYHGGGAARTELTVVPGSGTGGLAGLRGRAEYAATGMEYILELDYDLD